MDAELDFLISEYRASYGGRVDGTLGSVFKEIMSRPHDKGQMLALFRAHLQQTVVLIDNTAGLRPILDVSLN